MPLAEDQNPVGDLHREDSGQAGTPGQHGVAGPQGQPGAAARPGNADDGRAQQSGTGQSGARLRLARQARGFSQQQLAQMARVSRQAVSAVETGQSDPLLRVALTLSRALGMTVEELFGPAMLRLGSENPFVPWREMAGFQALSRRFRRLGRAAVQDGMSLDPGRRAVGSSRLASVPYSGWRCWRLSGVSSAWLPGRYQCRTRSAGYGRGPAGPCPGLRGPRSAACLQPPWPLLSIPSAGCSACRSSRPRQPVMPGCWAGWAVSGPCAWSASREPEATARAWPGAWQPPVSGLLRPAALTARTGAGRASPTRSDAVSDAGCGPLASGKNPHCQLGSWTD
jgi:transcriptional regulator with XRE-family HTH domain